VTLGLGVVAHEGGTLLVVLNSLRLLWVAPPRQVVSRGGARGKVDGRAQVGKEEVVEGAGANAG